MRDVFIADVVTLVLSSFAMWFGFKNGIPVLAFAGVIFFVSAIMWLASDVWHAIGATFMWWCLEPACKEFGFTVSWDRRTVSACAYLVRRNIVVQLFWGV